jgi:hypothetical protein
MTEYIFEMVGLGSAGIASAPQIKAMTNLAAGQPLMLNAAGVLVANDGTAPIAMFAATNPVLAGQTFQTQGYPGPIVVADGTFVPGTAYYMQSTGLLGTTVTSDYAGTAISATTLVPVLKTAAAAATTPTAASLATALAPFTTKTAASVTNKLLANDSFHGFANATTPMLGTFTGTNNYQVTPAGIHYNGSVVVTGAAAAFYGAAISAAPAGVSPVFQTALALTDANGAIYPGGGYIMATNAGLVCYAVTPGSYNYFGFANFS